MQNKKYISIKGIKENNLKNFDIDIPKNQMVVISGVSGSGKSSLAYDVLARESQRRYFETFSASARLQLGKMHRPEADHFTGLSPVVIVDQKSTVSNSRSTIGTLTEIFDYLRLMFARLGRSDHQELSASRSLFSFNSPVGSCTHCKGLGLEDKIDVNKLIRDANKSLREGALNITTPSGYTIYSQVTIDVMDQVCNSHGFNVDIPWKDLSDEQKHIILNGSDRIKIPFGKHTLESRMKWSGITAKPREEGFYKGIIPVMEEILIRDRNPNILRFAKVEKCSVCHGKRLNTNALSFFYDNKSIYDFSEMTIAEMIEYFSNHKADQNNLAVIHPISEAIKESCFYLQELGLGYLKINRNSESLSGGEVQRIRLAKQVRSKLRGLVYVLDEPSIGLHLQDNKKLIHLLRKLQENGNSVIIVEHDEEIIRNADHLIDIGPGAGYLGGEIIVEGNPAQMLNDPALIKVSKTLQHLSSAKKYYHETSNGKSEFIFKGIRKNNLKNIDVSFKTGAINVVTGLSGSGKKSLVHQVVSKYFSERAIDKQSLDSVEGAEGIKNVIEINQSPIGRTPRSNPATYTKLFDHIRKLFSETDDAKAVAFDKSRFSFNTAGGRCETCQGAGRIMIGMHFMGDVDLPCPECAGKRFNADTLKIHYQGKSIHEILEMEISDARIFFKDHKKLNGILSLLENLGLGYLSLGQSSTTISGGEAQRIKLASELAKNVKGNTLYILDEPTTGLHFEDIDRLMKALKDLTSQGHTIICIENQPDFILHSDWMIDLGPGSGEQGGLLTAIGKPSDLLLNKESISGRALNKFLSERNKAIPCSEPQTDLTQDPIRFKNLNIHNIKNESFEIPLNKLSVITGVSGSGKSSFAFDTLFAEGQSRYLESFPNYIRARIEQKKQAEYEEASGLSPVIAISQDTAAHNPRSTVGTMTEIYDYYRLMYARVAALQHPEKAILSSHFSFNHESGACEACKGLGIIKSADPEKLITHPEKSILDGAMNGSKSGKFYGDPFGQYISTLKAVAERFQLDLSPTWNDLNEKSRNIVMLGTAGEEYHVEWKFKRKDREGTHSFHGKWNGFIELVNEEYQRKHADKRGDAMLPLMQDLECPHCKGERLKPEYLNYHFAGFNISQLSQLCIKDSIELFNRIDQKPEQFQIPEDQILLSREIRKEIQQRLQYLDDLGIGYLNLNRISATLSGGEAQRVRLAGQFGSGLTGITYILDEPTVGLHERDTHKLIKLLQHLRDLGNTVVIVEHDEHIIRSADHIIDMGPGAGLNGGKIIAEGTVTDIQNNKSSITGTYLRNGIKGSIHNPIDAKQGLSITKANAHNLKHINVDITGGCMNVINGVSGSGKSTLLYDVIAQSHKNNKACGCENIQGFENFNQLMIMDQSPIGTSPLSNPATYTGIFDQIRDLFAQTPESKSMKLKKTHFSFNSQGGRCEHCKGQGQIKVSMDFLADVWVECEQCHGKRYKEEILNIKYKHLSIYDILGMSIEDAFGFFTDHIKISSILEILIDAGLGYLKLGQASNTLSGGEAQRLKLAASLAKSGNTNNLYLLDEPTTGLHFADVEQLLRLFNKLLDKGNTLVVVEHHPEIIKQAGTLISLGPEGGEQGGYLL
ncbi:MAG: excinuclease ABC subunit UvrA [Bacteroidales bacterium]|nr:excinuclease ABC subunit UvrA [Bacteroidales bacterium]